MALVDENRIRRNTQFKVSERTLTKTKIRHGFPPSLHSSHIIINCIKPLTLTYVWLTGKSVLSADVTNIISWCRRHICCFAKHDLATLLSRLISSGTRFDSIQANANVFHYKSLFQICPYPYCAFV